MLLLLYGPGLVGGLVIPILGGLPDALIILISGFGSGEADKQARVNVGVGTLLGSTIMILTIPWFNFTQNTFNSIQFNSTPAVSAHI